MSILNVPARFLRELKYMVSEEPRPGVERQLRRNDILLERLRELADEAERESRKGRRRE